MTKKQQQVMQLVARGLTNQEIASILGIVEKTVKQHITHLNKENNCRNRVELTLVYHGIPISPVPIEMTELPNEAAA